MSKKLGILGLAIALGAAVTLVGCVNDADVVSQNISTDADNFKVLRRVVLFNNFDSSFIQTVTGFCSLGNSDSVGEVSVTCKTPTGFMKHIWKLADNTTVFAEQLDSSNVSPNFYKVVFKPLTIIPDIEIR